MERASQARLRIALEGLSVVWVGVHCLTVVAEARELLRSDRTIGLARHQAEPVHRGVDYDVVVDTSAALPDTCASAIMAWLTDHDS